MENPETLGAFKKYALLLFETLGDSVCLWITHNEPWVVAFPGHYEGRVAPGKRDFRAALVVSQDLLLAHGLVVRAFRERGHGGMIGIALNLSPVHPATERREDQEAAWRFDGYLNRWFLDPLFRGQFPEDMLSWCSRKGFVLELLSPEESCLVSQPLGFPGINYSRHVIREGREPIFNIEAVHLPGRRYSDMGWESIRFVDDEERNCLSQRVP